VKQIELVAIKLPNGDVCSLKRPNRHHDVIALLVELGYPSPIKGEQGFVYNGLFLDRKVAGKIALSVGQIEKLNWPPKLFSEDLW